MAGLHTTTLTAISLALLLSSLVSAVEFTLNSPDSTEINESFSVSLSASVSEDYDVKIFVQDNSTKTTISEIYNDGWKNPFYYLKSVFPSKSEFEVRITDNSDNAVLCARLRRTNSSTYSEKCNPIKIIFSQNEEKGDKEEIEPAENILEISQNNTLENQKTTQDFTPSQDSTVISQATSSSEPSSERIILNSVSEDTDSSGIFVTKQEKVRLSILYGFTILSVVIIILLALKRL